jgi:hypothetical protein
MSVFGGSADWCCQPYYRSLVSATTASDANSSAALRQRIAVSFASVGCPRTGSLGSKRLASVGLLAGTIGNFGFINAHYSAVARGWQLSPASKYSAP